MFSKMNHNQFWEIHFFSNFVINLDQMVLFLMPMKKQSILEKV